MTIPTKFYDPEAFLRFLEALPMSVIGWAGSTCQCPIAEYAHALGIADVYVSQTNVVVISANEKPAHGEPLNEWQREFIAAMDTEITPDEARKRGRHGYTGITKREAIETMRQIMGPLAEGGQHDGV